MACCVFWFRRDLRLEDNLGLCQALSQKQFGPVVPVFIFDTNILSDLENRRDRRLSFIHTALTQLNLKLHKKNTSLITYFDTPLNAFRQIINEFSPAAVFCNHDYEPYALQRDAEVKAFLEESGVSFFSFKDQVIFEQNEVLKDDGLPYTVFTPYSKKWKQKLAGHHLKEVPSETISNYLPLESVPVISLEKLGFMKTDFIFEPPKIPSSLIRNYHETRNFPAIAGTSRLGVHLRFGTISIRQLVAIAKQSNEVFLNELIWREFFMQILWHFPRVVTQSFRREFDNVAWTNNEDHFEKWCIGETGYPLVDAGMRELLQTGYMHNRVRMVCASFLCKHLLIDWKWGEAYFAKHLNDYDLAANNGGWQWSAGTGCDAAPYFRIFNPYEQARRFDPEETYIRKWVPDYKTTRYPKPIIEHTFARNRALTAYRFAKDTYGTNLTSI